MSWITGIQFPAREGILFLATAKAALGAHPAFYPKRNWVWGSFSKVIYLEHEADHALPSWVKV
jgi:hypothetical protein